MKDKNQRNKYVPKQLGSAGQKSLEILTRDQAYIYILSCVWVAGSFSSARNATHLLRFHSINVRLGHGGRSGVVIFRARGALVCMAWGGVDDEFRLYITF